MVFLDEAEHFLHNRSASVATLRALFAFGPECRSRSLWNQCSPSSESPRKVELGCGANLETRAGAAFEAQQQDLPFEIGAAEFVSDLDRIPRTERQFPF